MHRPIPPLPTAALILVQVGVHGLPEPWDRVEQLEAIRVDELAVLRAPNDSFLRALETEDAFGGGTADALVGALDERLAALGAGRADVLDVDVLGGEVEILSGANVTLDAAFAVEVDVELNPLHEGAALAGEADALLRGFGFELFQLLPRRLRRRAGTDLLVLGNGQPAWAEALYLKGPGTAVARLDALTEPEREEAIGRAVSVCLLYGFGDYALDLVDSTILPVPVARRLRRAILRYDAHVDRRVPARFQREEHGRILEPVAAWLGELNPAAAPGRTHVSLELEQARRLFRVSGRDDKAVAGTLREALAFGLRRMKEERRARRSA